MLTIEEYNKLSKEEKIELIISGNFLIPFLDKEQKIITLGQKYKVYLHEFDPYTNLNHAFFLFYKGCTFQQETTITGDCWYDAEGFDITFPTHYIGHPSRLHNVKPYSENYNPLHLMCETICLGFLLSNDIIENPVKELIGTTCEKCKKGIYAQTAEVDLKKYLVTCLECGSKNYRSINKLYSLKGTDGDPMFEYDK